MVHNSVVKAEVLSFHLYDDWHMVSFEVCLVFVQFFFPAHEVFSELYFVYFFEVCIDESKVYKVFVG